MPTLINPSNQTITQYSPLVGAANNLITNITPGASGTIFQSGGASANPAYTTATYPATTTVSQVLYSSATNVVTGLATANSAIFATNSSGVPSITTASGNWLNTTRTCFAATNNSLQSNVTGDGTAYTVLFPDEIYDQGSNFASSTFTAPVTGIYYFFCCITLGSVTSAFTNGVAQFINSTANYRFWQMNPTSLGAGGGSDLCINGSAMINMTAGGTCTVRITIIGGTKIVDIYDSGTVGGGISFGGYLIC